MNEIKKEVPEELIPKSSVYEMARDKLNGEKYQFKNPDKTFIAPYIRDTLLYFVSQSEKFAAAVLNEDKSLMECIDSMKLVGKRASDLDVYNECVKYYMPEAVVEFEMKIKLPAEKEHSAIFLKLEDFF